MELINTFISKNYMNFLEILSKEESLKLTSLLKEYNFEIGEIDTSIFPHIERYGYVKTIDIDNKGWIKSQSEESTKALIYVSIDKRDRKGVIHLDRGFNKKPLSFKFCKLEQFKIGYRYCIDNLY